MLPLTPVAGMKFTNKSAASTLMTRSLNVTVMLVRPVTVIPAAGTREAIVGATVLVGGAMTTTVISGEKPSRPSESAAQTERTFVPKAALVQTTLKGLVVSVKRSTPLVRKSTSTTSLRAVTRAEKTRLVGPLKMEPWLGLRISTSGEPSASYTATEACAEEDAPWLSVATARTVCRPGEGLFHARV